METNKQSDNNINKTNKDKNIYHISYNYISIKTKYKIIMLYILKITTFSYRLGEIKQKNLRLEILF
jgi:hypothetical protein